MSTSAPSMVRSLGVRSFRSRMNNPAEDYTSQRMVGCGNTVGPKTLAISRLILCGWELFIAILSFICHHYIKTIFQGSGQHCQWVNRELECGDNFSK